MSQRRFQILSAAADLIAEKGFAQTSVEEVIARAGLSGKSHFYHYFKSKDELGYEVVGRRADLLGERGLAILRERSLDPMQRLGVFIDSVVASQVETGAKCGSPFGVMCTEMAALDEGFRLRIAQLFRVWCTEIQGLLEEAGDRLIVDGTDAQRLARFIIAALEGATQMSRMKRDATIIHGVAADLKRFLAFHLRPAEVQ